jgi:hypothetical protein
MNESAPIYESHKLVTAIPMNRAAYNVYRGWKLPANEDGLDEGYLVEYLDGGKPNHEAHKGYISWSPKEQFDNGYSLFVKKDKVEYSHIEELANSLEFKFERVGDTTTTGCWAFLPNGFNVGYGESACVDPKNYDKALGEKYAKERCLSAAKDKLWELEGYLLKVTGKTSDQFKG